MTDTLRYGLLIGISVLVMYLFSFYTDGQLVTYIHDGMDSNIAIYKMLADGGYLFLPNNSIVPNMMGGMSRSIFFSELNIVSILFLLFEADHAIIINELLMRLLAFIGTVLLLRTHILMIEENDSEGVIDVIIIAIALSFSLLPYWSLGGASVAAQPLVLYAFLNLSKAGHSRWNWFVFFIYPFYSALVLSGMFALFALGVIWIVDAIRRKKMDVWMLLALILMSSLYLIAEYRLVLSFVDSQFVSNRVEFQTQFLSISESVSKSIDLFSRGQYHAYPLHERYLMPMIAIFGLLSIVTKRMYVPGLSLFTILLLLFADVMKVYGVWYMFPVAIIFAYKKEYLIASLILFLYMIAFFAGFEDSLLSRPIKESWPLLEQISFDRFYFLFPVLWMTLSALTVRFALRKDTLTSSVIIMVLLLQVIYAYGMQNAHTDRKPALFDDFYSAGTYAEIKEHISLPVESYRVMSVGLHPSAAIYNGFYTVDGYIAYYPLKTKHDFRKIIEPELDKDEKLRNSFDSQGGRRCRLMSRQRELRLDLEQFKKMGGRFILSAYPVKINSGEESRLSGKFLRADGHNHIFLYKVL